MMLLKLAFATRPGLWKLLVQRNASLKIFVLFHQILLQQTNNHLSWSTMSPPLILNRAPISRVHQHKHLGLWLTPSLDWGKQVQQTGLRANGKLAVLQYCKFLDRSTLDMLYKITIRSVLEYGLVFYFHS